MNKIGAVITGDIIKSSSFDLRSRDLIRKKLSEISDGLHSKENPFSIDIPLPIDVFQGDSWQVIINRPELSLRIGLFIRASIRSLKDFHGVDSRFSIGIGEYLPLPKRVSLGDGSAYILSGRGLQKKAKSHSSNIMLETVPNINFNSSFLSYLDVMLTLIDQIAVKWTSNQAQAVAGALQGWNTNKIALNWKDKTIGRRTVSRHLIKAGWDSLEFALIFFEKQLAIQDFNQ
jgi:hypothetical protein